MYRGLPLLHGHTHDHTGGPDGHQFHVGVDAFGLTPIPMTLIDAWLEDLRREEEEIAAIVRDRSAAEPSTPLSEVAERLGIYISANSPWNMSLRRGTYTYCRFTP